MCSWCYGFSPVISALAEKFGDRLSLRVVMGGLRAGNTQPMRDKDRDYIRSAWTSVREASGQSFDFAFLDRESFVYDTEPACRAVVVMRNIAPEKTLKMNTAISEAFYANNRDVTDIEVLSDIAAEQGEDRKRFRQLMLDPDIRNETFRDFLFSQQSGVEGFPCLLVGSETAGYVLVTHGYRPLDGLPEALTRWLEQQQPTSHADLPST